MELPLKVAPHSLRVPLLALALVCAVPALLEGQISVSEVVAIEDARPATEVSDSLFTAMQPRAAYDVVAASLEARPESYEGQWRAARAALVLGVLADSEEAKRMWFEAGDVHADAALAADSAGIDGLYWSAGAKGRLALYNGVRGAARLTQEMWDLTHRVLEIDSLHPGAHNLLGKLSYEVMRLSGWQRTLGRVLLRTDPLREASWERARYHHEIAVRQDSTTVLFLMDLAQTYQFDDDPERAVEVFERALELPSTWPVDEEFKRRIRGYLEELDAGPLPGAPVPPRESLEPASMSAPRAAPR